MKTGIELGRSWLIRFVELQGIDTAMALAARAFAALIPLLIVVTAVLPRNEERDFADALIDSFDLKGSSAGTVRQAFSSPESVEQSFSWLGVALTLIAALSFTRGMQRLYERSYQLPALGVRGTPFGLAWLALVALYVAARPVVGDIFEGPVGRAVVSLAFGALLWTTTPYVLLGRRLSWRSLLLGAALASVGLTVLATASIVWLPEAISSSSEQFGLIGVAFALLSWLFSACVVLVVATTAGAVLIEQGRARRT